MRRQLRQIYLEIQNLITNIIIIIIFYFSSSAFFFRRLTVSSVFWPLFPIYNFVFINITSNIFPSPIILTTIKYFNCSRTVCHRNYGTETFRGTSHVHSVASVGTANCAQRSMVYKLRYYTQWPTVFKNVKILSRNGLQYRCAPVYTDSVYAVHRGPKKNGKIKKINVS
jgi:hypothetical protein